MNQKICKRDDCEYYPYYGLAPHSHDLSDGSFIGSTRIAPKSEWPDNFIEDADEPGAGIYYCPECKSGMKEKPEAAE